MASNAKDNDEKALKKEPAVKKTSKKLSKSSDNTKADNTATAKDDFLTKLEGLVEIARKNKDVIESDRLNDYFKSLNIDSSHYEKIYDYSWN